MSTTTNSQDKIVHYPNIEEAFNFTVHHHNGVFRVDTNLPGTPLVGIGKSEIEAKYNLCVNWLYLIANYDGNHGGDSGYVPIILRTLKEDMNRLGQVIKT